MQVLAAVAGAVVLTTCLRYPLPNGFDPALSLAPAAVMVIALLAGWHTGLMSLAAALAGTYLLDTPVGSPLALLLLASIPAAGLLRRGATPATLAAILFVSGAGAQWLPLPGHAPPPWAQALAWGLAQAVVTATMATLALVAMPRRGRLLQARCRIRWDHLVFVAVCGTTSLALLLLPGAALTSTGALRQIGLIGAALATSLLLAHWCRSLTRRLPRGDSRWPVEVASRLAGARRTLQQLRRGATTSAQQLQQAQAELAQLQQLLHETQQKLQQRTQTLQEATLAADEARARVRALMGSGPDGTLLADADGLIRSASPQAAAMLGTQPPELIGKPVHSLIPPDHVMQHPLDMAGKEDEDAGGPSGTLPAALRTPRGTMQLLLEVQPFKVRGARHHLIVLREPSRTAPTAARGSLAPDVIESGERARDLFIASMSHELRTPLHGLIATLDMLRVGDAGSEEFRHQLSIARNSARALLKIANDVLDLARIKSSLFTVEHRPFSLPSLLREVLEETRARATSLGLTLSTEIAGRLPPAFLGDPARIKQILGNLVSNALKFTTAGGVTLEVRHDGRQCTIDVRDTGSGIPPDKRQRIFEPFVQLDAMPRPQAGGTGLGLPISRQLAQAMKGDLVLLQSGTSGSTFRLTLPLEASNEEPPDEQSQRILSNPRGRILVVEDNPANRYVAQALLAGLGCPATIVESGQEALQLLREQEFDLILMDCQMPGMDGYEATRQARRMLPLRIPIIAMTANAMTEDRGLCIEAGMDDFLPKPFDRHALNAILCKWLARAPGKPVASADETRIGMHPDLDVVMLDELRESLQWRRQPMEKIRDSFSASVERTLPMLDRHNLPREALHRQLHTLLGSAGMVGAKQVEFLVRQIQLAVKENQLEALDDAAELLHSALRRYQREFDRRLNMGADTDVLKRIAP